MSLSLGTYNKLLSINLDNDYDLMIFKTFFLLILYIHDAKIALWPKTKKKYFFNISISSSHSAFYYVNYGSSIIMSKVCQIISVMKT